MYYIITQIKHNGYIELEKGRIANAYFQLDSVYSDEEILSMLDSMVDNGALKRVGARVYFNY
jgi:hypothetical protein